MRRNAILLTIFMMVSKVFGMIRESILSFYYGSSAYADVFFTASSIPNVIFAFIAAGLVTTFIPIYSRIVHEDGEKRADGYLSNILSIIFVISLLLTSLGLIFTEQLVSLVANGFEGETLVIAISFVRVTLFAILTNGIFSIFNGYHQYHNRFLVDPVNGFIMNFVIITAIVISARTQPIVMAYGVVIASVLQATFTYFVARSKSGYKFKPGINLQDEYIKPMLLMAGPIIIGSSISQVNAVIDRRIASTLATGAISTLNYATKISDSIYALFVVTITTVMYPTLNKQAAKGDFDSLQKTVTKIMNTVVLIVAPATVGLMVLSTPVTQLFFGRGAGSDPVALARTATALFYASIGIIGYGLRQVLTQTFYSLQDSLTPVISAIITVAVNISLNLLLAPRMGVAGLALATSISAIVGVITLYYQLSKKIKGIPLRKFFQSSIKISFASALMGLAVYFGYQFLSGYNFHYTIPFAVSILAGVIVYIIVMSFMNVPEYDDTLKIIKGKIGLKN